MKAGCSMAALLHLPVTPAEHALRPPACRRRMTSPSFGQLPTAGFAQQKRPKLVRWCGQPYLHMTACSTGDKMTQIASCGDVHLRSHVLGRAAGGLAQRACDLILGVPKVAHLDDWQRLAAIQEHIIQLQGA